MKDHTCLSMIGKTIFWNISFVWSQKAFDRLMELNRTHKYNYISLMEPFQGPQELEHYKRELEMGNTYCNYTTKKCRSFGKKNGSVR